MTGNVHRLITTIAGIFSGVGAFLLSADAAPFGIDAYNLGLSMVWAGTIVTIVGTTLRANWLPGVTTGVGHE